MRERTHPWGTILHEVRESDSAGRSGDLFSDDRSRHWVYGNSWGGYRNLWRAGGMAAGAPARAAAASDGRVRRNIHRLAVLWTISGILRLVAVGWMMIFGRMFIPFMRGPMVWPLGSRWGWDCPFSVALFPLGIFLGLFGVLHLVLAWGLFEREPWARFLGLALGFLALIRLPFGTALGIYTLWVLLPEASASEYDRLAQNGGHVNSAAASSH